MKQQQNRPLKSSDWVMQSIRRQIEEGMWREGDKLASVVELARQYKVGQSTVREALTSLKTIGLLDVRQGSGTYIKAAPERYLHPYAASPESWLHRAKSIKHILEVRRVLETGCAQLACRNRSDTDLARMRRLLADMERSLDDEKRSEQTDIELHETIAQATHNPVLIDFMASLSGQFHDTMRDTRALWFYAERSSAERLLSEHQAIVLAIAERDPSTAAVLMEQHIAKVEQVLSEQAPRPQQQE